jgi:hypothetical protein
MPTACRKWFICISLVAYAPAVVSDETGAGSLAPLVWTTVVHDRGLLPPYAGAARTNTSKPLDHPRNR